MTSLFNELSANNDLLIFKKFSIFVSVSYLLAIIFIVISFFKAKLKEKIGNDYPEFDILNYFIIGSAICLAVFGIYILSNEAGYSNGRFPIYPMIGKGEFFFVRDAFLISCFGMIGIDYMVMARLVIRTRWSVL
ncbi:hypothetical protein [Coralliovum pocilloporae]|uniref:hypothetical protein n=1 Tax=Coralliovum pocilloporae TaxID=3066369 RepID=UPI0033074580